MFKLFTTILLLLVAAVVFFGYTKPAYSHVQELRAQSGQLNQILSEASEFQKLKSQLIARYNALPSDKLARLSKLLPDHVDNVRLILDIDSLAGQNGLALENVVINSGTGASGSGSGSDSDSSDAPTALGAASANQVPYGTLTMQFKTEGSYQHFLQFLHGLEGSLRLVDVTDLTVSQGSSASAPDSYAYAMTIQTYWLK
ncbi:MAG TPA: hypothetical protein VFL98_03315 [Candidatus Paceibacterota bacterium]|nr:hypothetical protein [Candidatus Paceibacterota bacterium]